MQEIMLYSFSCETYDKKSVNKDKKNIAPKEHSHERLEIIYVVEGNAKIKYISKETGKTLIRTVNPKQFALIKPGCTHSVLCKDKTVKIDVEFVGRNKGIEEYISESEHFGKLSVTEDFFKSFKEVMILIDSQNVRYSLNKIKQYFTENEIYLLDYVALDFEFMSFFIEVLKCFQNKTECADKNFYLRKALSYINMYFSDPDLSVKELAKYSSVSEAYLQKLFQDDIQCSVHEFITRIRMSRARNMILRTNFAITEIAKDVGYASQQSFINNFRKAFGTSPEQFKKEQNAYNNFSFRFVPPDFDKILY